MRAPTDIRIFSDAAWKSILASSGFTLAAFMTFLLWSGDLRLSEIGGILVAFTLLIIAPTFLGVRLFLLRWVRKRVLAHQPTGWAIMLGFGLGAALLSALIWTMLVMILIGALAGDLPERSLLIGLLIGGTIAAPMGLLAGATLKWFSRHYEADPSHYF